MSRRTSKDYQGPTRRAGYVPWHFEHKPASSREKGEPGVEGWDRQRGATPSNYNGACAAQVLDSKIRKSSYRDKSGGNYTPDMEWWH